MVIAESLARVIVAIRIASVRWRSYLPPPNTEVSPHRPYAAPIGAFFCPEIRAFTGFWGEISSTASKVLVDRKVLFKHKNGR